MSLNWQFEWAPCDLCGADSWETLFIGHDRRHRLPGEFGVAKCLYCGHLQTNPRPSRETLPAFYPETYFLSSMRCDQVRRTLRDSLFLKWAAKQTFAKSVFLTLGSLRFHRFVPKWLKVEKGLFLDVGCGVGWLCALAKEVGWRALGVDISLPACKIASQTWGVSVLCSDGLPLPFKADSFHLVTLRHVLEHFPSPRYALSEVYRVLKNNGWVAIEVPNAGSLGRQIYGPLWHSWDLPRHLHHFTPETLERLMKQVGFQKVRTVSAKHKPFMLASRWFSRNPSIGRFMGAVFGLPLWLVLPLLIARKQGEVLRAWGCKVG